MSAQGREGALAVRITPAKARRALVLAWISVACVPIAIFAGMLLGESLLTLQGYESSELSIPLGVALKAALPAILVLVAPATAATWFGFRAVRHGLAAGLTPAVIGVIVLSASVLLNGLPLLLRL